MCERGTESLVRLAHIPYFAKKSTPPLLWSHPTVGVEVVGLANEVPVRWSSSSEELASLSHYSSNFTSTYCFFVMTTKAWKLWSWCVNENAFETM